ncbi:MAG: glycosylase [Planctomycetes bacterium]|nr:glycosylase [Planctomycetota bacterium]
MPILRICVCLLFAVVALRDRVHAGEPFPRVLTHFEPVAVNPVFTGAGEGHWDVKIRERGWILREGDHWRMWYTGYDGTRPGQKMLGYATSTDGMIWNRHPRNPLCKEHWIEDVCVIPHNGTLYMFAEGEQDRAQMLTSRDGIAWTRVGRLDVRLKSGEPIPDGPYGTPTAWLEDGVWNLFYERGDKGIWLARSRDLKVFTNVQDEPVMVPGPDEFDHDLIAMNQVIKHDDRYYAVFHGSRKPADPSQPSLWATGLATSTDLIHWTKYAGNPLRPIGENKSSGLLIHDGKRFRLYTMHGKVDVHLPPSK